MGAFLQFVDYDMQQKLLQYVSQIDDVNIQEKFAQFRKENVGRSRKGEPLQKHISYNSLQRLLILSNLSGKEFFVMNGIDANYPPLTEHDDTLLAETGFYADRIDADALEKIISITEKLVPSLILSPEMMRAQPTKRALLLIAKWHKNVSMVGAPEPLMRSWKDKHGATSFSTKSIPDICDFLKVSPHWLMKLEHACFACKNERTEYLLDLIPFVGDKSRIAVINAIRDYAGIELAEEWKGRKARS